MNQFRPLRNLLRDRVRRVLPVTNRCFVRPLVVVLRRIEVVPIGLTVPLLQQAFTHMRMLTVLTLLVLQKLVNVTPCFFAFIQLVTNFILRVVEKVRRMVFARFVRVDFVMDLPRTETRLKVDDPRFVCTAN